MNSVLLNNYCNYLYFDCIILLLTYTHYDVSLSLTQEIDRNLSDLQ